MKNLKYRIEWIVVRFTPLMYMTIAILGLVGIQTLFGDSVLGYIIAIFYTITVIYWMVRLYDFIIKDLKQIEDKINKKSLP